MKTEELHKKGITELNAELLSLLRAQFNLRMQIASNQLKRTHLLKQGRQQIACIKTLLNKKTKEAKKWVNHD